LDCVVGVNELDTELNLTVFPNPANNMLNIRTDKVGGDVKIFDLLGNVVWQGQMNSKQTSVDISALSAGVYAVEMTNNGQRLTSKVIVQ